MLFKRKKYSPTEQKIRNWNNKYLPYILWAFLLMCAIGWLVKKSSNLAYICNMNFNQTKNDIKKFLIAGSLSLISMISYSQVNVFYFPSGENSAQTSAKMENAQANLDLAYEAYNEGDMEKTKYYLDQSERNGMVNGSFYYLLGQWFYDEGKHVYAERYWMRGYKKRACWECKELLDKAKAKGGWKPKEHMVGGY